MTVMLQTSTESNELIDLMVELWTFLQQDSVATLIALAAGGYMALLLYRRSMGTEDPSVRKSIDTAVGSYSMLMSGAFAIAALASVVAVVTWPAPVETPLGLLLVGGVLYATGMEYWESRAEGS